MCRQFACFVGELGDSLSAFYAAAEVLPGQSVEGSSYWPLQGGDRPVEQMSGGKWLGVPKVPVWLTWLGPEYLSLLGEVPAEQISYTRSGAVILGSDDPLPRDELESLTKYLPLEVFARVVAARAEFLPDGV